jgi:hypothetical protein
MLASQTLPYKPPKKGEAQSGRVGCRHGNSNRHLIPSILARAFWPEHSGPSILARAFWPEHVRSQLCPARCCLT